MRSKTLLAVLAAGLFCSGLFIQQAQATLVTGSITFAGTVQLDTASAGTATTVTAWGGNLTGGTLVPAGLSGVRAIAAADGYSAALKDDGTVVTWGGSDYATVPAGLSRVFYF